MMNDSGNSNAIAALLAKTSIDSMHWSIEGLLDGAGTKCLAFLNAHAINTANRVPQFHSFLMGSDYLLRDGIGVKLALKLFGLESGENLNGTDLITKIIYHFKDKKIAVFGASDEALLATKARLQAEGNISNIIALEHGFHEFPVYSDACKRTQPDIVVLCMGMPKQELLAAELKKLNAAPLIICGGGWADFYSGTKKRAPLWVRKCSMEWVYRLLLEPKRLGKRYTIDILYFFWVIFSSRFLKGRV